MSPIYYCDMHSPVGRLILFAQPDALIAIVWENEHLPFFRTLNAQFDPHYPILQLTKQQLNEYFTQQRSIFDIPYRFCYGTPFQQTVWQALTHIPYGDTISYKQLAERIHRPKAMRAVGAANGKNPLSILVPCHRVIGANGQLVGFGGGLDHKRFLIELEKHTK